MDAKVTNLLRRTTLFGRLTDAELRSLARLVKERRLERNQVLFRHGEQADSLYVIVSGRLRVSAADRIGHERVLAFLGSGEVVGEMGLLNAAPRSATVIASTDVELLQVRKPDFDALVGNNLEVMRDLARVVASRNQTTQQRAMQEASSSGGYRYGLVTAVFSPRGGAGTTTLAVNLAAALAQRAPERVIVVDLNTLFGHVPVLLNVVPRTALAAMSAVSMRQMDRENLEFYLTRHAESSLRVLSGTLRPEQGELVTADHVRAAIEVLRTQFVHVIVDLGRSFSEVNLTAIEACHNLLVVCTPERVGVRGVAESQRIFRELVQLPGEPLQYVLNHPSPYAPVADSEVARVLGIQLLGSIPYDGEHIARAALEGNPLVTRFASSPAAKAITRLADLLEQQLTEARALTPSAVLSVGVIGEVPWPGDE